MRDFQVKCEQLDPDDERSAFPLELTLRVGDRDMCCLIPTTRNGKNELTAGGRWLPFRGPRLFQWLLTPLRAASGILVSSRDLTWLDLDAQRPRLQITPCVPADFFFELTFQSQSDADSARELIGRQFRRK